ncbi:MAG TPA: toluene tolerance protein [Rhodospirillaceae bacterium]|nr:toluene tolerance protein [Rhodospirillaceae bacterium]HAT35569.1 toluene tolerance protein [Rhodospirillaceae bacterium]
MFQHCLRVCFALLLVGVVSTAQAQTSPEGAADFLRKVGDETIVLLKDVSRPKSEKEAELRQILEKSIDMRTIGRFALGKTWREIDEDQQDRYLRLFRDYVLYSYSKRLLTYAGETFNVVKSKPVRRDALVYTLINQPSGQPLKTYWRIRHKDDHYYVIDVIVEGISMAVTQRSEFRTVIRQRGVEGFFESLESIISSMRNSTG